MGKPKKQSLGPPPSDAVGLQRWLGRVQEIVETGLGHRGDGKSAFVEKQDLVNLNLAGFEGGVAPGRTVTLVEKVTVPGDTASGGTVVDTAPAGPVENLVAIGDAESSATVVLLWDPTGIPNYGGAKVYRATTDNFGAAVSIGQVGLGQRMYVDQGRDSSKAWYYWVRALKSTNALEGALNQVNGTLAVFDPEAQAAALEDAAMAGFRVMFGLAADNAIIDEALISALVISNTLQSDNYVPGQAGWILKK